MLLGRGNVLLRYYSSHPRWDIPKFSASHQGRSWNWEIRQSLKITKEWRAQHEKYVASCSSSHSDTFQCTVNSNAFCESPTTIFFLTPGLSQHRDNCGEITTYHISLFKKKKQLSKPILHGYEIIFVRKKVLLFLKIVCKLVKSWKLVENKITNSTNCGWNVKTHFLEIGRGHKPTAGKSN